jgi:hypothetical protein
VCNKDNKENLVKIANSSVVSTVKLVKQSANNAITYLERLLKSTSKNKLLAADKK